MAKNQKPPKKAKQKKKLAKENVHQEFATAEDEHQHSTPLVIDEEIKVKVLQLCREIKSILTQISGNDEISHSQLIIPILNQIKDLLPSCGQVNDNVQMIFLQLTKELEQDHHEILNSLKNSNIQIVAFSQNLVRMVDHLSQIPISSELLWPELVSLEPLPALSSSAFSLQSQDIVGVNQTVAKMLLLFTEVIHISAEVKDAMKRKEIYMGAIVRKYKRILELLKFFVDINK